MKSGTVLAKEVEQIDWQPQGGRGSLYQSAKHLTLKWFWQAACFSASCECVSVSVCVCACVCVFVNCEVHWVRRKATMQKFSPFKSGEPRLLSKNANAIDYNISMLLLF